MSVAADRRTVTEATEATQPTDVTEVATLGVEAEANRLLLLQLLRSTELTVVAASVDVESETLPLLHRWCAISVGGSGQTDGDKGHGGHAAHGCDRGGDTRCGGRGKSTAAAAAAAIDRADGGGGVGGCGVGDASTATVAVPSVSVAADRRTVTEATAAMQLTEVIEVATAGAEAEANRLLLQLLPCCHSCDRQS